MAADLLALDGAGVRQYKALAYDAFAKAREHRARGDLNSADEATRFGASYREQARAGTTRGTPGGRTTWRYGDLSNERKLP